MKSRFTCAKGLEAMATNKNGHCELPYMEIGSLTAYNGGLDQL